MSATNQKFPNRDVSENRDESLMKGHEQHDATQQRSPGLGTPNAVMGGTRSVASGAEAELSLFFDADESMEDDEGPGGGDVLGWDVDMDHTASVTVGSSLSGRH